MAMAETRTVPTPVVGELPGAFAAAGDLVAAVQQLESGPLWQLGTEQVQDLLALIGWARHRLGELERHTVAEGLSRGLPAEQGSSPVDWVSGALGAHVPAPPPGHAAQVVRLARAEGKAGAVAGAAVEGGGEGDLAAVFTRLAAGELSVVKADQIVRFHTEVAPVADPGALGELTAVLTEGAADTVQMFDDPGDPGGVCTRRVQGLTDRQLGVAIGRARRLVKPAADLEDEDQRYRAGRALFKRPGPAGMAEYRWILDPEGAAVVDAALAGLSGLRPAEDGTPDPRSPARRRAEALLDLVARAVSCPDETIPARTRPRWW